jgi:hypothetical protein
MGRFQSYQYEVDVFGGNIFQRADWCVECGRRDRYGLYVQLGHEVQPADRCVERLKCECYGCNVYTGSRVQSTDRYVEPARSNEYVQYVLPCHLFQSADWFLGREFSPNNGKDVQGSL